MRLNYWLLILLLLPALAAISQSAVCYQTVPVKCGDTVAEYLTKKEVKNLYKLQLALEKQKLDIEYLQANNQLDSAYIAELRGTIAELEGQVNNALQAKQYSDKAYNEMVKFSNILKRQIRNTKVKAWAGGVMAGVASFGAGVGVAFVILKTK